MAKAQGLAAWLTMALLASPAPAQSLAEIGGPANPPPASFTGQQFVDARGCLFLRAGSGGRVTWVARIDRNHRPICGMPPMGSAPPAEVAEAPSLPPVAAPRALPTGLAAPALPPVAVPRALPAGLAARCPADAPNLARLATTSGTVLVCTRGDGTLDGWRPPMLSPGQASVTLAPAQSQAPAFAQAAAAPRALPKPPKGWTLAWKDDRLNPLRALGTAEGEAEQDRIWQRKIPMIPVVAALPPARPTGLAVSTMSQPAGGVGLFVQVGSFARPANASAALARVEGLGLPVRQRGGAGLHSVLAGPFDTPSRAAEALRRLRAAGFADAVLR